MNQKMVNALAVVISILMTVLIIVLMGCGDAADVACPEVPACPACPAVEVGPYVIDADYYLVFAFGTKTYRADVRLIVDGAHTPGLSLQFFEDKVSGDVLWVDRDMYVRN